MTTISVSAFNTVYYFPCSWRHHNLVKAISVIFRRIVYGQKQQVLDYCYPLQTFPWASLVHSPLCWRKYDNSDKSKFRDLFMVLARFLPSAPWDLLSTRPTLLFVSQGWLEWTLSKSSLALCLPDGFTNGNTGKILEMKEEWRLSTFPPALSEEDHPSLLNTLDEDHFPKLPFPHSLLCL